MEKSAEKTELIIHKIVNEMDERALKPLFSACDLNDYRAIGELITKDPSVLNKRYGLKKDTLLHRAANLNRSKIVSLLLDRGAALTKDLNGNTPLHIACVSGGESTINRLVQNTRDLTTFNSYGEQPIHLAATAGNITAVRCLVDAGVDPSSLSQTLETPLHSAASGGHCDVMKFLLDLGLQVDAKNQMGQTALFLAAGAQVSGHSADHVKLLIDHGAYIGTCADNGDNVIHAAGETGTPQAFKYLLDKTTKLTRYKKDGDAYVVDKEGRTVLQCVAKSGCETKATLLLEKIINTRYRWNRSQSADELTGRRNRSQILFKELTQQEMEVCKMYRELSEDLDSPDSVFRSILQSNPSVIEHLFDSCIMTDPLRSRMYDTVQFDFFLFNPENEMAVLDIIIAMGKFKLMAHPLIETFVELKWWKIWKIYTFFLLLFCIHMICVFGYTIAKYGHSDRPASQAELAGWWYALLVMNSLLTLVITGKVISFVLKRAVYRGNVPKYKCNNRAEVNDRATLVKEVLNPLLSFVVLFVDSKEVAVCLVMISGFEFIMNVTRVPRFGLHVFLTGRVFRTILEFFVSYIVQIFGFALVFHILMEKDSVYGNLGDSFLKVLTMLLGEFDFSDMVESEKTGVLMRIMFSLFLLLMSIVLMNLVVGLAISDIESMRKDADVHKMIATLVAVRNIECINLGLMKMFKRNVMNSTVTNKNTCNFTEKVILELQDIEYAKSSRIYIVGSCKPCDISYRCSTKIVQKVSEIVKRRWRKEREVTNSNMESILERVSSLEKKLEQYINSNSSSNSISNTNSNSNSSIVTGVTTKL